MEGNHSSRAMHERIGNRLIGNGKAKLIALNSRIAVSSFLHTRLDDFSLIRFKYHTFIAEIVELTRIGALRVHIAILKKKPTAQSCQRKHRQHKNEGNTF